jgi:hypothetical protein
MFMSEKIINAKADPVSAFQKAIDAAISAADRGVSTNDIVSFLRARADLLENRYYRPNPPTRMHGADGKLIDWDAKVDAARRERQRIADEGSIIPPHLRQHASSGHKI